MRCLFHWLGLGPWRYGVQRYQFLDATYLVRECVRCGHIQKKDCALDRFHPWFTPYGDAFRRTLEWFA